ncbi:MAG: tetratricopeptide repeat protein [Planctomycetia bacterium]|nr:tetratricopeptide repeat protein [Planctomycetia bacterium]
MLLWLGCAVAQAFAPTPAHGDETLATARALFLAGKYEEAIEAYQALDERDPVGAALGLARAKSSTGQLDEAAKILLAATMRQSRAAQLPAEAAQLALSRGAIEDAKKLADAALAIDPEQLAARWVQAELHRMAGRLDEANAGYKWFVDYYNGHDVNSVEAIEWIGLAAAQFARWNRLKDQFGFLVNELYPDALKIEPNWWPAHYYAGLLYLEKYNQAEAARELKAALAQNPNAACVHAALARLALQNYELDTARQAVDRAGELNPRLLDAHLARGDILLANFQAAEAIAIFEKACQINPASETALGRLAAAYGVVDGLSADLSGTRMGRTIDQATTRNKHCGEFHASLARALDESRRFPAAARYYREAIARMPQLVEPHAELGLVAMRLGEEVDAKQLLDEAFTIDPFNVRVANTLKVLEVLDGYALLETPHFVIKFDRGADEIMAQYAARYLEEEVYPQLCERFGFEPQGKSLFEIFSRARNTSGHGWFSARMVGLPFVHTVGACAGKIVALASPGDMPKKFNWARVLKHEFVHVLNLQQTDFAIPHWFTEALAVGSEGFPRPQIWNELLAERVPKGQLFNLDTINLGFVRPQSSNDWQMAYCQADLYARYITETYGATALAKMLSAYRDNLDTAAALKREFAVDTADFERGYVDYVRRVTADQAIRPAAAAETLAQLERARESRPDDAQVLARLAHAYLARKDYAKARQLAEGALGDPRAGQLAAYVLARVRLVVGENAAALKLLADHLDRQNPDPNLLNLLAGLKLKAEEFDTAAELYALGEKRNPADAAWLRSLARVYLAQKNDVKLTEVLSRLAPLDADDLPVRKKLAQLALAAGDFAAAARWSREALFIDVMDVDVHRMLGEARAGAREFGPAADEYEVAVKLSPKEVSLQLALAESCAKAGRKKRAQAALEKVLELEPGNTRATALQRDLAE